MSDNIIEPEMEKDALPDLAKRKLLLGLNDDAQTESDVLLVEDDTPSPDDIIADYIRTCSNNGQIVAYLHFLAPPFSVPEESLQEIVERFAEQPDYHDIVVIEGSRDNYYYSTHSMANNYAKTLVLLIEQDSCKVIAEAVRFECSVYPRPYRKQMLRYMPYCFSDEQIEAALILMKDDPDYQDIQDVSASNNEPYLFSTLSMSYGKAKGLCEWFEVEQHQNP